MPANDMPANRGGDGFGPALIVEDNVIIALELEALLEDLGVSGSFIAGNVQAALALIDVRDIAFAIVDMDLGHETSEPVAETLVARGVPFIFATGYGDASPMSERFPAVPTLMKPFSVETLYTVLEQAGILRAR